MSKIVLKGPGQIVKTCFELIDIGVGLSDDVAQHRVSLDRDGFLVVNMQAEFSQLTGLYLDDGILCIHAGTEAHDLICKDTQIAFRDFNGWQRCSGGWRL